MIAALRPALSLLAFFTLLTGLAYPLALTGVAQAVLPGPTNGSLIVRDGRVIGSSLIGQVFTGERYFHGRPSATTAPDPADPSKSIDAPYNAAASTGSNLGPTSKALQDAVRERASTLGQGPQPADLVTSSASGLDPHISPAAALAQVERVARARGLAADRVRALVIAATEGRDLGFLGEPRVNVLALNIALDTIRQP